MAWALIVAGLFSVVCAAMDFDWFMNNHKTWLIKKAFGRHGARIFYIVLGLAIAGLGVAGVMGAIQMG